METSSNHLGLRIMILTMAMVACQRGVLVSAETAAAQEKVGMYFAQKAYEPKPLAKFGELRSRLPSPIYDDNRLVWQIAPGGRCGCERFRFNGHVVSLIAGPPTKGSTGEMIHVQSGSPFELQTHFQGAQRTFVVKAGEQEFDLTGMPKY